ncbi:MAG: hypothetical protein ABI717_03720 [Actinomycetota bacterium]
MTHVVVLGGGIAGLVKIESALPATREIEAAAGRTAEPAPA